MDNLPLECVEHILSFLPIADVFVCRSVCKKWKGAADLVIRSQKALTFFVVDKSWQTGTRDGIVMSQTVSPNRPYNATAVTWTKRLEGMARLEKLTVNWPRPIIPTPNLANPQKSLIDAVIMRNASTLTTIDMECNSLPFLPEHRSNNPVLVYGKLQNLICVKLTPAAAAACPRLVRLDVGLFSSAEMMQNLPHGTVQYLRVACNIPDPQETETFVSAVSLMTQLKELKLILSLSTSIANSDPLFTKLFSNMKQLDKIYVKFPYIMDGTTDFAIDRLVRNNPRLTQVQFNNANVTAASLVSLSRLTAVQHLSLYGLNPDVPEFTTGDILTLLRGGSRQVLQYVRLDMRSRPDERRIKAETEIMEQEMGCRISVFLSDFRSDYRRFSIIIERSAEA